MYGVVGIPQQRVGEALVLGSYEGWLDPLVYGVVGVPQQRVGEAGLKQVHRQERRSLKLN